MSEIHWWEAVEKNGPAYKQAEKYKSRKMKEGWMINDEGWMKNDDFKLLRGSDEMIE